MPILRCVFATLGAIELGRGGVSKMSEITGMSRPTIIKGMAELRG
ncbi:MAG TPA: ISAzo13 family transposase, partial [Planctomycetes bacterium]|nr:ISAzo13 family transposase [Planctomycetota bacterium]